MDIFNILVIWTLGLTAAIVLALAGYLIPVAYYLYRTSVHLTNLVGGLKAIRGNAAPLAGHLDHRAFRRPGALPGWHLTPSTSSPFLFDIWTR